MPAHSICSTSRCLKVVTCEGKCDEHKRKPWANTSARNLNLPKDYSRRRRFVLQRDKGICYLCGRKNATEVDHVRSVANGGNHEYSNLKSVCHSCHVAKTYRERQSNKDTGTTAP